MDRKKILILMEWYLPGRNSGGPVKSIEGLVFYLKHEFDIYILTTDTDLGMDTPYPSVETNKWVKRNDGSFVYYLSRRNMSFFSFQKAIQTIDFDFLYVNSLFSFWFSIYPVYLNYRKKISAQVVLSVRGMLSEGAMNLKRYKKVLFIFLTRLFHFYDGVRWHATSEKESSEIRKYFTSALDIRIAPNVVMPISMNNRVITKQPGQLRLFFLSRISRVKNLHVALKSLLSINEGEIIYDIFGPIEDKAYFEECQQIISVMPENIRVQFKGTASGESLPELIRSYHFLFLPTGNENFGHSIVEALQLGCPVIISNKTPWRNLEAYGCGWDLEPVTDSFFSVLKHCLELRNSSYQTMVENTFSYSRKIKTSDESVNCLKKIFS